MLTNNNNVKITNSKGYATRHELIIQQNKVRGDRPIFINASSFISVFFSGIHCYTPSLNFA
jgi:hypothetical protein